MPVASAAGPAADRLSRRKQRWRPRLRRRSRGGRAAEPLAAEACCGRVTGMTTEQPSAAPPPAQVWPTLRASDARGLIRFLVEAFGFEGTVVYGEGDVVEHAQLSWPLGGGIMLGSVRDVPGDPWPVPPGSTGCYVVTDDPDG